ncbi:MAG: alpha/beta fold hydrolase [Verrucomicrobiota bacterium]
MVGRLLILLSASSLLFSSCASKRPVSGALVSHGHQEDAAGLESILVATTRESTSEPGTYFTGERSDAIGYARMDVSIPGNHESGQIELPKRRRDIHPKHHFSVADGGFVPTEAEFRKQLRDAIRESESGEVGLFIHGYNTHFSESVFFLAQLAHDTEYAGVPLLFTWPSRGQLLDYPYDLDSVMTARDWLEHTIRLAKEAGAKKIAILAHSMGTMLTMETLRQVAIQGDPSFGGTLDGVLLASPDISIDTFRSQMRRIGDKVPIAVMISKDDKALSFSQWLAGDIERVGKYSDNEELAELGVAVIDLTDVGSKEKAHHAKFAEHPNLINLAAAQLQAGSTLPESDLNQTELLISEGRKTASVIVTAPGRIINSILGR